MKKLLLKVVSSCLLLSYSTTLSVVAQAKPTAVAKETWMKLDKPVEQLRKDLKGKNVMIFFHADWCLTCQVVKQHLQNPEVLKAIEMNKIQLVSADLTDQSKLVMAELKKLAGEGTVPFLMMIDSKGNVTNPEVGTYLKAAPLLELIEKSFAVKK